jgi:putative peptidoglycan lipid II flippase
MGVEGLALAISVSATLEVAGLLVALRIRLGGLDGRVLGASVARSAAATLVASVVMLGAFLGLEAAAPALADGVIGRLLTLLIPAALGGAAFLLTALALRSPELIVLRRLVRRRRATP